MKNLSDSKLLTKKAKKRMKKDEQTIKDLVEARNNGTLREFEYDVEITKSMIGKKVIYLDRYGSYKGEGRVIAETNNCCKIKIKGWFKNDVWIDKDCCEVLLA